MDFEDIVKRKYNYLTYREACEYVARAKSICIEKLYPSDLSVNLSNFDWSNPRFFSWILDCVDELIEKTGMSSVVAYKENNMSWTFDKAGVSQALLDRLPSIAHAVGGKDNEEW